MRLFIAVVLLSLPVPMLAGPADVVDSNGCVFFDANKTPRYVAGADKLHVYTNNEKGNATATCQGQLPESAALPDRVMHFSYETTGFYCLGGKNWEMVVTPSGRSSFTCHAN